MNILNYLIPWHSSGRTSSPSLTEVAETQKKRDVKVKRFSLVIIAAAGLALATGITYGYQQMNNSVVISSENLPIAQNNLRKADHLFYDSLQTDVEVKANILPFEKIIIPSFDSVLMGEYGVAMPDSQQPIIESFGANPCVIISIHNEVTKKSVIAHIHANTKLLGAITKLLREAIKEGEGQLIVELASGEIKENQTLERIKEMISNHKHLTLNAIHHSTQLSIDSRTGVTSTKNLLAYSLSDSLDMMSRMIKNAMSLTLHLSANGKKRTV